MQDMEQAICERAYHMWDNAGRPYGRSDLFWLSAQRAVFKASLGQIANVTPSRMTTKPNAAAASRERKIA